MRLFTKYIFKSIKRSPLQPLLILLTLTVAVATLISSAKIIIQLNREISQEAASAYHYDLAVSLSAESDSRILIAEEVQNAIGEGGVALGEFSLTGTSPNTHADTLIDICATNLLAADEFYQFRFTEYGTITDKTLARSIILSTTAAEALDIGIGDTFSLKVLNKHFDFTVEGIALPDGALASHHGMIDVSAVTKALIDANPAMAHIADGFHPANSVKIQLTDAASAQTYREIILSNPNLSHTNVATTADALTREVFEYKVWILLTVLVICIVILISVTVMATSQNLLQVERRSDTALFLICGAEPHQLRTILYLEALLYAAGAAGMGLALSLPINSFINSIFEWKYGAIAFEATDILMAFCSAPVVAMISTVTNLQQTSRATVAELLDDGYERKHTSAQFRNAAIWGILTVASVTVALLLPVTQRYVPALIAVVLVTFFAYFIIPSFLAWACGILGDLLQKAKRIPPRLYLAVKTLGASHPLMHSVRIVSVLIAMLISVSVCLVRAQQETNLINNLFDCSFVATNMREEDDQMILANDAVEQTYRITVFDNISTQEGDAVLSISAEDSAYAFLNERIRPDRAVGMGEIAISKGIAKKYQTEVGDTFTILRNSQTYSLTVCEILDVSANVVIVDAHSIGESNTVVCIRTKKNAATDDITALAAMLEPRGSLLSQLDTITKPIIRKISSYLALISAVVVAALVAIVMGVANLLIAAHKKRARERELYYTIGMTHGDVRKTTAVEIAAVVIACLIIIPLLAFADTLLLDMAANTFGFDIIF